VLPEPLNDPGVEPREPPPAEEAEAAAALEPDGPERVTPATLPGDVLGGKFLDPSGR
jgi:hypothetical protein